MAHFAYPNVAPTFNGLRKAGAKFIGCGRFAIIPDSEKKIIYRSLADRRAYIKGIEKIEYVYEQLVADTVAAPDEPDRGIYERVDKRADSCDHKAFTFAYFLAMVSCCKKISLNIPNDIWCTGRMMVDRDRKPYLDVTESATDASDFEIGLRAFLRDDFSSLFIVPEKNITPNIKSICKTYHKGQARIQSLNNLQTRYSLKDKTILKVKPYELKALVFTFFESGRMHGLIKKLLPSIPAMPYNFLLSQAIIPPVTGRRTSHMAVTHFAYPNIVNNKFVCCGRLTTFPNGYGDKLTYFSKFPDTPNLDNILDGYKEFIHDFSEPVARVYEKRDQPEKEYQGGSLDLAYFLSLVACYRPCRLDIYNDIWCTGCLPDESRFVENVDVENFNVKLESFLQDGSDDLFIVPEKNINQTNQDLLSNNADVLSVKEFKERSFKYPFGKKTILKVKGSELPALIDSLFIEKTKDLWIIRLILTTIFVVATISFLSNTRLSQTIESDILDYMFRIRGPQKPGSEIIIIGIDDTDINLLGPWAWLREKHLLLLQILQKYRVRTVGYDILFFDSHHNEADFRFSEQIETMSNVVVPMTFEISGDNTEVKINKIFPYNELKNVVPMGFVYSSNGPGARNGFDMKKEGYYFFGLEVLKNHMWCEDEDMSELGDKMVLVSPWDGKRAVIPLDEENRFYLNYHGPQSIWKHQSFHFNQVLKAHKQIKNNEQPVVNLFDFSGKIVLVGAAGTAMGDIHRQSFGNDYGLNIIATFLDNALNNDFITRFSGADNILLLFLLNFVLGFMLVNLPKLRHITAFLAIAIILGGGYYLFLAERLWIDMGGYILGVLLTYILAGKYIRRQHVDTHYISFFR